MVSTLINSPFNLPWGSSVYAKVLAQNIYGSSGNSSSGNGAIIITYPDPPMNLIENPILRTSSTITFSWTPGNSNGGSTVTDYRINSDGAIGLY
jgi:hypothetical protein